MARLNDPPVPIESVDALKRRFIRQNREIARVNSTQSLRIRNLEAEISRLLAENIALREQAITSAQEAERLKTSSKLVADVGLLKNRLESKLSEVNALVVELGTLSEKAAHRSSHRRRSGIVEAVKSPDQKDWRNRQTIGGIIAGDRELPEGRLPAILEDKYYPRQTLDTLEIQTLSNEAAEVSESPDLGPPPIAQFEIHEPIKFDPKAESETSNVEDERRVSTAILSTRRKRRTSSLLENITALDPDLKDENHQGSESEAGLNPGSKRKLSARDEEETMQVGTTKKDGFMFQRKSSTAETPLHPTKGSRFTRPQRQGMETADRAPRTSPQKGGQPVRKVLAPKSTNSPTKPNRMTINDKIASVKGDVAKQARSRNRQEPGQVAVIHSLPKGPQPSEIVHVEMGKTVEYANNPPKTPGASALLSPASTEPSTKPSSLSTEMAITTSVEDVLSNAGRGSRRARTAISYAEPNLRDKMRRPGKELVAAVEGIERFRDRETSAREESVNRQTDVQIKKEEPQNESFWHGLPQANDEPPSPLKNKSDHLSSEAKETQHGPARNADPASDQISSALTQLSIFDGPSSSPHADSQGSSPFEAETLPPPKKSALKSRRHSSNPAGSGSVDPEISKPARIQREAKLSTATGLRHQGYPRAGLATEELLGSAGELKRSTSTTSLDEAAGRVDRAARRRSMMV